MGASRGVAVAGSYVRDGGDTVPQRGALVDRVQGHARELLVEVVGVRQELDHRLEGRRHLLVEQLLPVDGLSMFGVVSIGNKCRDKTGCLRC